MTADKPTGTALALAGSTVQRGLGHTLRVPIPFDDLAQAVSLAQETGYAAIWVPDHGVWDPFALLAALAGRTSRMGLGTGVVTMTSRTPGAMASAAATLHRVSGGRAILGLGSGPERRIEQVSGYLHDVRDGPEGEEIPVYLAALGPRMVELAARAADGVLLNWCPPERVARARQELARAAEHVGRDPAEVSVAVYVRACLGHDEDHALAALRQATAMYAGLPAYRRQLAAVGLGAEADAAAGAQRSGDLDDVPVRLVRAVSVWGDRDDAMARLEAWREAGADLVVVYPVTAQEAASSLMGTIMAAAPTPAVEH